jgi:hypothetical protein
MGLEFRADQLSMATGDQFPFTLTIGLVQSAIVPSPRAIHEVSGGAAMPSVQMGEAADRPWRPLATIEGPLELDLL